MGRCGLKVAVDGFSTGREPAARSEPHENQKNHPYREADHQAQENKKYAGHFEPKCGNGFERDGVRQGGHRSQRRVIVVTVVVSQLSEQVRSLALNQPPSRPRGGFWAPSCSGAIQPQPQPKNWAGLHAEVTSESWSTAWRALVGQLLASLRRDTSQSN